MYFYYVIFFYFVFRVMFPIVFVTFHIFYWAVLVTISRINFDDIIPLSTEWTFLRQMSKLLYLRFVLKHNALNCPPPQSRKFIRVFHLMKLPGFRVWVICTFLKIRLLVWNNISNKKIYIDKIDLTHSRNPGSDTGLHHTWQ